MTWIYVAGVIIYFTGVGVLATVLPGELEEAAQEEPRFGILIEMHPEKVCVTWPVSPLLLLAGKGGGGGGPRGGKKLRLPAMGGARS